MKTLIINFTVILYIFTVIPIIFTDKNNNFTDKIFYPKFDKLQHITTNNKLKYFPIQMTILSISSYHTRSLIMATQLTVTSPRHRGTKVSFTRVYCDWYTFCRFKEIPYESLRVKDSNDDGYAKTTGDSSSDR